MQCLRICTIRRSRSCYGGMHLISSCSLSKGAIEAMLQFLNHTAVGQRKEDSERRTVDEWDVDKLDQNDKEDRTKEEVDSGVRRG